MSRRAVFGVLALALVSAAAGFGAQIWLKRDTAPEPAAIEQAPEITLADLAGQPRKLSHWRGKLMLVNFWATWCAPCIKELPLLVQAQQRYAVRGFQIVGPALDAPDAVRSAVQRFGINYPIMAGDADVIRAMDVLGNDLGGLPFSVLIAPDGRILERITGGLTREKLAELIDAHLPG
jgi:thiol-disulfide isomerase/thioredoxin